jgi:peptide-methionine (S)-S-oxide reductase
MKLAILITVGALAGLAAFHAWRVGMPADRFTETFSGPRVLSAQTPSGDPEMATATFAAGCFWHVQLTFDNVPGVLNTTVGYTGGHTVNPTYEQVCTHTTGHAEAVRVQYDPSKVSYEDLLKVFWASHDPTTPNRQGPDVGSNYRSAIFYHTPEQRDAALKMKAELEASGKYSAPIVTEIAPAGPFYIAEDYHQHYLDKQGMASCPVSRPLVGGF